MPTFGRRFHLQICLSLMLVMLAAPGAWAAAAQDRYELTDGQWELSSSPEPGTPAGDLQAARRALADDRPADAQKLASAWIDAHPDHPLMAEARMIRGDALLARGRRYQALYDYEYIIRVYPESPYFHRALEREYDVAEAFVSGTRRRLWGLAILPAYSEGEELLIRIQERAPGSELGEAASLRLAEFYQRRREMADAAEAYDLFLLNYPQSQRREYAMRQLIQANLKRVQGLPFDPTGWIEASERLRTYREEYPAQAQEMEAEALQQEIGEQLAAKDLRGARWQEQRGEVISAAYLYERVMADHPGTAAADEAAARLEGLDLPVVPGLAARGRERSDVDPQEDAR